MQNLCCTYLRDSIRVSFAEFIQTQHTMLFADLNIKCRTYFVIDKYMYRESPASLNIDYTKGMIMYQL